MRSNRQKLRNSFLVIFYFSEMQIERLFYRMEGVCYSKSGWQFPNEYRRRGEVEKN